MMSTSSFNEHQKFKYLRALTLEEFDSTVVRRLMLGRGYKQLDDSHLLQNTSFFLTHGVDGAPAVMAICVADGPLTLAQSASDRLNVAVDALRYAAGTYVWAGKIRKTPDIFVLAVPDVVNTAAQKYIEAELEVRNVQFLDRSTLAALVDKEIPDVWREVSANVTPYLHSLAKLVDEQGVLSADTLHLLGAKGNVIGAADGSFVEVKLVRPVTKVTRESGKVTEHFEFEEITSEKLAAHRSLRALILGEAGTGKSTLLIRMAYLMAKGGVTSRTSYKIPLYARAIELAENNDLGVLEICSGAVKRLTNVPLQPFLESDLEEGRVYLLIDGLDEVSSDLGRSQVMTRINAVIERYPRLSVAITTRPYASIDRIAGIEKYIRYRISPISLLDAQKIVSQIRGPSVAAGSLETLRKLDAVHGMALNPLFVTVFGLLADTQKKDLPANITELFSKFTELMLGRWDTNKGLEQQYQSKVKEDLVSKFSFGLHKARRTRFSRSEFEIFAAARLEELNLSSNLQVIVSETIDRSGLFRGDHNNLEFRHHLIQEYFAGLGIQSQRFVTSIIDDDWWRTPIVFFFGRTPDSIDSLRELANSIPNPLVEPCITVGLALQTLYLSPIRERIEVWKWVVGNTARSTASIAANSETPYPLIEFITYYLTARDAVALTGIERPELGAIEWAMQREGGREDADLRLFWAATGLVELGQIAEVKGMLESHPIKDEKLNAALYIGCQMVATVRAVDEGVRAAALEVCKQLEPGTAASRLALIGEFRGRLLELRKGEIVALDEEFENPR